MSETLLQTKLYVPELRPNLVPRPRLDKRLELGLQQGCKLTLLSAPVGYGKTTLVSNWLSTQNYPIAWLSLDAEDNDPLRFWTYVIAALQTTHPELGQTLLASLQISQMPPIEKMLSNLINQITELPDKIILVLDDYHLIETIEIHNGLNFLLLHFPFQLHLIIITREDPPFPLPQMRVKGQIVELRAKDVCFTMEESTQFLKHRMNLDLQAEEIAALERRTEGWVAGLQMAALSMQEIDDTTGFIKSFAGDDRYVVDYLIEEVIERQTVHIQEFLMQTAILKRLTAPLCDAVSGKDTGRDILAYLEETNLFLISLDNKRQWYRYHQLFGDLLQYRLRDKVGSEGINRLHQGAAGWYAKNGFVDEAIYHYLASGAFSQSADLIEAVVVKLFVQGQIHKVLSWLSQLPEDFTRKRPLLSVSHAWVLSVTGQGATAVETRLKDAERSLPAASQVQTNEIQALISNVRAYLARNQGNIPLSIQHLRQSIDYLETDNLIVNCSVNLNLGFNYSILGELKLAEQALLSAQSDGRAVYAIYLTLLAMATQGIVLVAQGKLRQAVQIYQEAIAYGSAQNKGYPFPPAGYAYAGLGLVLYEQNDLNEAEKLLTQAIEFGELMGDWSMKRRGLLPLAWLKQMQGDSTGAQALWQRALSVVNQAESSRIESQLRVHEARLWLAQAALSPSDRFALAAVADWAKSYQQSQPDPHSFQEAFAQTTLAWVELAQDLVDQALSRLQMLIETARVNGWNDTLIKALVLKALACATQGDPEAALGSLDEALAKAAPEGYIRSFVDHGLPMQQLLLQAAARGLAPDYIPLLLASFPAAKETQEDTLMGKSTSHQALVEPFTDRELRILQLMAAGLSHSEIAGELYLSVNTIKWYTTHIYSKLGVHRRAKAVSRAQELGIV
jgi:LuxR family maltose regulon positive regulatory protein